MAFKKKEKKRNNANHLNDPEIRAKFKASLNMVCEYLQQMDDIREGMKETIEAIEDEYSVDKGLVRKMANTIYKQNYGDLQSANHHFEQLYEFVVGNPFNPADMDSDNDE